MTRMTVRLGILDRSRVYISLSKQTKKKRDRSSVRGFIDKIFL